MAPTAELLRHAQRNKVLLEFAERTYAAEIINDPAYTPAVSVAIPTYNEARHIEEKLEDVYSEASRSA